MTWQEHDAVLFDLDGVITPTAEVHMRAWSDMFSEFLASWDGEGDTAAYTDVDYFAHVDGKPRYDGVRDFLTSRGIPAPQDLVRELGDRKNDAFNVVLARDGVQPYPGSVRLLDHLGRLGTPLGVVSSSANAPAVLEAAGLLARFRTVMSGAVATELGLPGKPAPDTFLHAAAELGATPQRSVVLEDAVSGVRAGRAGDFGRVVGVDRGAGEKALREAGADVVVADLADLVPAGDAA
ncbi:HAD family hydrolase [Nocardioides sp. URHA0032]|uniref:HAD family hydrolase n=1 Tax=Nocardioides sp. URHA0032 TaxID=1380388 RepID=UPI00048FB7AF|nr:beta-phosphoglucomutase family hydrolase [Nocardioides sp. URHA0032]